MAQNENQTTALATVERGEIQRAGEYLPVMNMAEALARRDAMVNFVSKIMVKDKDYGVIPGTGDKPTLMKPGAEKLLTFFGLRSIFEVVKETEDWQNGFFYYWYKCRLFRGETCIAEGEGSCSSMESKYRWRKAERKCPQCGQPAIIKGKREYGGGYVCFKKKGGCDAKFKDGDPAIESQPLGRVPNPDIYDQVNTLQKMAQKRALVAATLIGVNASEFFTQDIEDMVDATYTESSEHYEEPPRRAEPQGPTPEQLAAEREARELRERRIDQVVEIVKGVEDDALAYLMATHANKDGKPIAPALQRGQSFEQLSDRKLEQIAANPEGFRKVVADWKAAQKAQPVEATVEPEAGAIPDFSKGTWKHIKPDQVTPKEGEKNGRKFTRYAIRCGDDWYSTFHKNAAALIEQAVKDGAAVWVRTEQDGDYITVEEAWIG